jgi:linoleoyl-CoA desaturase
MNIALMFMFEYGIALYDMEIGKAFTGKMPAAEIKGHLGKVWKKVRPQVLKDYVVWPLLSGPSALTTLAANATANIARNVWTHSVIFCGHFPDEVQEFTIEETRDETRGGWYVRQLLGSANLDGGKLLHLMTGQLSFQIEHHLFPDLPSNRYCEIAPRVRELCQRYDLPYVSGPLPKQLAQVWVQLARMSLPPKQQPAHPKRLATSTKRAA